MYEIITCYGVPQCGFEVIGPFDEFYEVIDYIDAHPLVGADLDAGYARIVEL